MKYLLLTVLVFAVAIPATAKVIEISQAPIDSGASSLIGNLSPVFAGKGETELSWDDGTTTNSFFSNSYVPYATTFTAPADCHLLTYRYYWYNGTSGNIDSLLFEDNGSSVPTGTTIFTVAGNTGTTSYDWFEIDVSGEGVTIDNGVIFHPGWSHAETSNGLFMDSPVAGSYACWLTLSGSWYDYSGNATHMMRVVINDDMDGPVAAAQDPADGDTGVSITTDILFDIDDSDIGVDSSTITDDSVVVTDDSKAVVPGTLTVDDADPNNVHVTFDPDSDFPYDTETVVTVTVSPSGNKILDDLGNEMAEDSWSFTVFSSGIEAASLGEIKANFK